MNAIDIYRAFFRAILRQDDATRVSNDSIDHALVLIEELISFSKSTVDIYCHKLSLDVWGVPAIKKVVRTAHERGVAFRVVVQEKIDADIQAGAFSFMCNQVKQYSNPCMRANFLIADRRSFRFEGDYTQRRGFAYVRNENLSGKLVNAFDAIYQAAG